MKKTIILQYQITPYRSIVFDELSKRFKSNLLVLYCQTVEEDRKWELKNLNHAYRILKRNYLKFGNNYLYINVDILKIFKEYNPDVVITYGFNPVTLIAWAYTLLKHKKHIILTDSWLHSVNKLTIFHRIMRKIVFRYTHKFVCVGIKGKEYLRAYNVNINDIFISQLVVKNEYYSKFINTKKKYDIMMSGRLIDLKMPFFFINIAKKLLKLRGKLKVLIIGNGELETEILNKLSDYGIDYELPGHVQQEELPCYYASSKLLLMPTKNDVWGIVANEACAVGTPVITCSYAGIADDLIINNYNGYILALDEDIWVRKIDEILDNDVLYNKLSNNALKHIKHFSTINAAQGLADSIDAS